MNFSKSVCTYENTFGSKWAVGFVSDFKPVFACGNYGGLSSWPPAAIKLFLSTGFAKHAVIIGSGKLL